MLPLENSFHCNLICILDVLAASIICCLLHWWCVVDTSMYVLCYVHFRDINFQHVRELSERWMCTVIICASVYIIMYCLFHIDNNIVCIAYSGANRGFIRYVPCLSITDILSIWCSNLAALYYLVSAININVLTASSRVKFCNSSYRKCNLFSLVSWS